MQKKAPNSEKRYPGIQVCTRPTRVVISVSCIPYSSLDTMRHMCVLSRIEAQLVDWH